MAFYSHPYKSMSWVMKTCCYQNFLALWGRTGVISCIFKTQLDQLLEEMEYEKMLKTLTKGVGDNIILNVLPKFTANIISIKGPNLKF